MQHLSKLNWLAIGALTILSQIVGTIWYGVLFKDGWQAATGVTDEMATSMGAMPYVISIIGALVLYTVMAIIFKRMQIATLSTGAQTAALFWLGFVIFQLLTNNGYAGRPVSLSLIDGGYGLVNYVLGGAILGVWQKGEKLSDVVDDVKEEVG